MAMIFPSNSSKHFITRRDFSFLYIKISRPNALLLSSMWHVATTAFTKFRNILRTSVHSAVKRVKRSIWEAFRNGSRVKMR